VNELARDERLLEGERGAVLPAWGQAGPGTAATVGPAGGMGGCGGVQRRFPTGAAA
jgi:hypothetical protein